MKKKTYLGDGLYAQDDGYHIILTAERENGEHMVALEDTVLWAFMRFVEAAHGVKIEVTKIVPQENEEHA